MRFSVLGSGSKGNCTLVESGTTRLLIDAGFSCKETLARLAVLGIEAESLTAIAVTHGLILVTRNTTDFMGYSGLSIENWFT